MTVAVLAGLVIGVLLGALGGGGSVLAVPVLAHLAGLSAAGATATSLVAVGASAVVASVGHSRAGRVQWPVALLLVAVGVPGAWAGALVNERIDGDLLLLLFSVLVLVAAQRMLTACPSCTRAGEEAATAAEAETAASPEDDVVAEAVRGGTVVVERRARSAEEALEGLWKVALAGAAVGFLTGLFGVGGGFVIVPVLTLVLGFSMGPAIGTSLAVVAGNAAVALAFRDLGAVDWGVAVPFTAAMLAASFAGSQVSSRLPAQRSLQGFAALLVAVAIANGVASAVALAG